jgi:hypothetical protein
MGDVTDIKTPVPDKMPAQFKANAGKGRTPGKPNRVTADIRNMAKYLVAQRADHFLRWIDRVALKDPARACDLYIRLISTYTPKPQPTLELELGNGINQATGQSVIAMRLRSLLEAPVNE